MCVVNLKTCTSLPAQRFCEKWISVTTHVLIAKCKHTSGTHMVLDANVSSNVRNLTHIDLAGTRYQNPKAVSR